MKIKVMIDSAADITIEEALKDNITVARFALTINNQEYLDEKDISLEEFKKHLESGSDITTSQTPLGELLQIWDEILEEYDHIIYLTLSKKLSGAFQSAYAASLEYDGKITVLDTSVLALPLLEVYKNVLRYVEENKSIEEIKDIVENHEPMKAFLVPYDIKHLKKGGRISPQAAALANMLKIVPVLALEDNVIDAYEKVRTNSKAIERAVEAMVNLNDNPEDYLYYILHSDLDDVAAEYKEYLESKINQEVTVGILHPVLLTHAGPKTFAIACIRKYP